MNHDELKNRTVIDLTELAEEVRRAPKPDRVTFGTSFRGLAALDKGSLTLDLKGKFPTKCRSLYSIRANDQVDREEAWHLLNGAKAEKREDRAYCRVLPFCSSPYLYVGSSRSLPKRLLEHFGFGAQTTYSLQLSYWASELEGTFSIEALLYPDISQKVLCALEDQMSASLQPMFGRRGSL